MKDTTSLHLKVQELCDCFATTDPLKEMSKLAASTDTDEEALKESDGQKNQQVSVVNILKYGP